MKTQIVSASKIINAPAEFLYSILADYQSGQPTILPKSYFPSLDVEEGGYAEGKIIRYQMRVLGLTQTFRALNTEPEHSCTLPETDPESNTSTSFTVWSPGNDGQARVTILTVLKDRGLVAGFLAKMLLTPVYRQELELLARAVRKGKQTVQAASKSHHAH